jgi:hypothetical protein
MASSGNPLTHAQEVAILDKHLSNTTVAIISRSDNLAADLAKATEEINNLRKICNDLTNSLQAAELRMIAFKREVLDSYALVQSSDNKSVILLREVNRLRGLLQLPLMNFSASPSTQPSYSRNPNVTFKLPQQPQHAGRAYSDSQHAFRGRDNAKRNRTNSTVAQPAATIPIASAVPRASSADTLTQQEIIDLSELGPIADFNFSGDFGNVPNTPAFAPSTTDTETNRRPSF